MAAASWWTTGRAVIVAPRVPGGAPRPVGHTGVRPGRSGPGPGGGAARAVAPPVPGATGDGGGTAVSGGFDAPRRRAFRLRTPLTLLVLVALLAGTAWYGVRFLEAPPRLSAADPCTPRPVTTVPTGAAARVTASQVHVTVDNLPSGKAGLAGLVSAQLQDRGFITGTPGNALDPVTGVAVVRAADPDLPQVALVRAQIPGSTFEKVTRYNPAVDVVIGPKFTALAKKAPTSVAVTTRSTLFPPQAECQVTGVDTG